MTAFQQVRKLEEIRQSRVLVLGASNLEVDLLPPVYEALRRIGRTKRIDVVLYCAGGVINAARRLALLLCEFTDHLGFIVPHHCESAGTVMALSAREIIAGPLAMFSPVDPLLNAAEPGAGAATSLCAQDVRLFKKMSQDWFGLETGEANARSLSLLCENIFPTTLTSFYRCTLEVQEICSELLALGMRTSSNEVRSKIAQALIFGYHSHSYSLRGEDLKNLGLPIVRDHEVEEQAWDAACELRSRMGPETRLSLEQEWSDALVATRDGGFVRRRKVDVPATSWEPLP